VAKRSLRKPLRWLHPLGAERDYTRALWAMVEQLYALIDSDLIPALEGVFATVELKRPQQAQDAAADDVEKLIQAIGAKLDPTWERGSALALDIGQKTSKWNSAQWQKILKQVLGVALLPSEPWLEDALQLFVKQNVALIGSLRAEALGDVEQLVQRALLAGRRHEEVAKEIREMLGMTPGEKRRRAEQRGVRARARLIARDQVAKLNGNLTQTRQKTLGVTHYVWRTSLDERVRFSHAIKEGKTFSWDKPPADTGHPGEDFQCRCLAEPVLEPLLEAV